MAKRTPKTPPPKRSKAPFTTLPNKSGVPSPEYRENWDRIFRKRRARTA